MRKLCSILILLVAVVCQTDSSANYRLYDNGTGHCDLNPDSVICDIGKRIGFVSHEGVGTTGFLIAPDLLMSCAHCAAGDTISRVVLNDFLSNIISHKQNVLSVFLLCLDALQSCMDDIFIAKRSPFLFSPIGTICLFDTIQICEKNKNNQLTDTSRNLACHGR